MEKYKKGYTCKEELCETRGILEAALLALVRHDVASDMREMTEHCLELQEAINVLINHCGYSNVFFPAIKQKNEHGQIFYDTYLHPQCKIIGNCA